MVRVANLEEVRLELYARDPEFRKRWDLVQEWSEESRYQRHGKDFSTALIDAVENRRHGVLRWLRPHW